MTGADINKEHMKTKIEDAKLMESLMAFMDGEGAKNGQWDVQARVPTTTTTIDRREEFLKGLTINDKVRRESQETVHNNS